MRTAETIPNAMAARERIVTLHFVVRAEASML